jgi:hypothetical protein
MVVDGGNAEEKVVMSYECVELRAEEARRLCSRNNIHTNQHSTIPIYNINHLRRRL